MSACLPPRRRAHGPALPLALTLAALAGCASAPPAATRSRAPLAEGGVRAGSPENCAAIHGTYATTPVRVRLAETVTVTLPGPGWCIIADDNTGFTAMHAVEEPGAPARPGGALSVNERLHSALFSVRVFRAAEYFGAAPQTLATLHQRVAEDAATLLAGRTVPRPDAPPLTVVAASAGAPIAGTGCVPQRIEMEGDVAGAAPPVTAMRIVTSRYCLNPGVAVVELQVTEAFVKGDPDADHRAAGIRRLADDFFASLTFTAPPRTDAARD